MRAEYRRAFVFVAMWLVAVVVVAATPDPSGIDFLTLKDGRQLSGRIEGDHLKFRSSIDTVSVSAEKIVGLAKGVLELAGIGAIEGTLVGGEFIVTTSRGEVRQPAVDVISIRRGVDANAVTSAGDIAVGEGGPRQEPPVPPGGIGADRLGSDRQLSVSASIHLASDGSGTSRHEVTLPPHVFSEAGARLSQELKANSPAGAQVTARADPKSGQGIVSVDFAFEEIADLSDKSAAYQFEMQPAGFFQAHYAFKASFPKRFRWPLTATVTLPGKVQQNNGELIDDSTIRWRYDPVGKAAGPWSAQSSGLSLVGLQQGSGLWGQPWLSPERAAVAGSALGLLLGIVGFALRHRIRMPNLRPVRARSLRKAETGSAAEQGLPKRFCTKCGAELVQGNTFCTGCGEPV